MFRITKTTVGSRQFGSRQAVFLMIGFVVFQILFGIIASIARGFFIGLVAGIRRSGEHLSPATPQQMAFIVGPPTPHFMTLVSVLGYLSAGIWSYWYLRRHVPTTRFREGAPQGLGFSTAPVNAYILAVIVAVITTLVAGLFLHFVPPTSSQAASLRSFSDMMAPGWPRLVTAALAVTMIPLIEELVFRGGGLAGLAESGSVLRSALIVTVLFVVAHAPQKIHYPPGFIDVTLLAAAAMWLRIKYRSLWPAILLHAAYNLGILLLAIFLVHHA